MSVVTHLKCSQKHVAKLYHSTPASSKWRKKNLERLAKLGLTEVPDEAIIVSQPLVYLAYVMTSARRKWNRICDSESALSAARWDIIKGIARLILEEDRGMQDKAYLISLSLLDRGSQPWPLWENNLTGIRKRLNKNSMRQQQLGTPSEGISLGKADTENTKTRIPAGPVIRKIGEYPL